MKDLIKKGAKKILGVTPAAPQDPILMYKKGGRIPWSAGYDEYRWDFISKILNDQTTLALFKEHRSLPREFGLGLDERCVEYPWIFSRISEKKERFLDAGSTFNFSTIVEYSKLKGKDLSILTYYPEPVNYNAKRISYVYADLREVPFRNEWFDVVVCQSTIEHIDMDNSIYGYKGGSDKQDRSFDYLKALAELVRVLRPGGQMLLTFPFGKFEHHGFFQQFDAGMLAKALDLLNQYGKGSVEYFKYERTGWRFAEQAELSEVVSFNPHSGAGKGDDGAAHCRSVACIEFYKSNR